MLLTERVKLRLDLLPGGILENTLEPLRADGIAGNEEERLDR